MQVNLDVFQFTLTSLQLFQIGLAGLSAIAATLISKLIWKRVVLNRLKYDTSSFRPFIKPLISYILFMAIFLIISLIIYQYSGKLVIFNIISQLSLFALFAHYIYVLTKSRWIFSLSLFVFGAVWYFNRISLLKPSLNYLNKYSLKLGAFQITPWSFLKSILTILIFLWITSLVSNQFKNRIKQLKTIKAGTKEILTKSFDIFIYFFSSLLILNVLGINLSTLTLIGGALGVGIGFGLQKITSNFVSGLILLFEKSIEIDDLIELSDGIYGFVRRLGSRYTLIETFDGKEILIPNEDFITNRVTNWTFSNKNGRIDIDISVSYKSDIEKAQTLILEAAIEHPRCIADPAPKCYLMEFGDSSVNFKLLFFVGDVEEGRWEPQSDVLISIWKKFKSNNIEIPYPQRDIHIKTGS